MSDQERSLETLFASTDIADLRLALDRVRGEIARQGSQAARSLFEPLAAMFYIDTLDHPELLPLVEEAISLVTGFGDWVIPRLVENLDEGDVKAQMASAEALGRLGADAIDPLVDKYLAARDAPTRSFVLYALGKIRSPLIVRASDLALAGARSDDLELRDTATRSIGRFVEVIPRDQMPETVRKGFHDALHRNLADPNKGIKAKAVRSLGKMARVGHLAPAELAELQAITHNLLGTDEDFRWDRAYVVRKEAAETLRHCEQLEAPEQQSEGRA